MIVHIAILGNTLEEGTHPKMQTRYFFIVVILGLLILLIFSNFTIGNFVPGTDLTLKVVKLSTFHCQNCPAIKQPDEVIYFRLYV